MHAINVYIFVYTHTVLPPGIFSCQGKEFPFVSHACCSLEAGLNHRQVFTGDLCCFPWLKSRKSWSAVELQYSVFIPY